MTGITRATAAKTIAGYLGSRAIHVGGTYDAYTAQDSQGRKWKVVSDASIDCEARGDRSASRLYAVEVVLLSASMRILKRFRRLCGSSAMRERK